MIAVAEDPKPHNQLLLFMENWFRHLVCSFITYSCLTAHYVLVPFELPFTFFRYALWRSYMIASLVIGDVLKLVSLLKLSLEIVGNIFETQKCFLFNSKNVSKCENKTLDVYKKIKGTLNYFHILPLSPRDGITGMLILEKVPDFVWKFIVPFPKFMFEDTFKSVSIREGKIVVILPPTVPLSTIVIKDEDEKSSTESMISNGDALTRSSGSSSDMEVDQVVVNGEVNGGNDQ